MVVLYVVIAFQNIDGNALLVDVRTKMGNSLVSEGKSKEGMANALRKNCMCACMRIAYCRTNTCGRYLRCCSGRPCEHGLWA